MLSVSRLLNGTVTPGDALRYGRLTSEVPAHLLHYSLDKKPIVVWNLHPPLQPPLRPLLRRRHGQAAARRDDHGRGQAR